MKKLIAISVVFALVAGVAFAVDLGGTVISGVNVIQADSGGGNVTAEALLQRVRLEGSGEVADGQFGGWLRFEGGTEGYAWWKPIDQLKIKIGKFGDGFWGQDGNSRWSFYQHATDTNVSMGAGHAWGAGDLAADGLSLGAAFAGGYGSGGLMVEITPVEMVAINIGLPFSYAGGKIEDVFKGTFAQVALNLSFGDIAFSYQGNATNIQSSYVWGYFGLKAIENLQIDFGLGTNFNNEVNDRLNIGIAVKYAPGTWGIKFRSLFAIPFYGDQKFGMLFDVLPYFVINETFRVYASGGVAISNIKDLGGGASWHVNPYLEIGEEWGAKFLVGIKVWQVGRLAGALSIAKVQFAVPIALVVSF